MIRYGRRERFFATALSCLAGYVDAVGFLQAGGYFVSFMSGNSTRLAVGTAAGSASAILAAGLITAFVGGVMLGTAISGREGTSFRPVLVLVAALLLGATASHYANLGHASVLLAAMAMGAENAIFARGGDVQIGLTYMTGTLVKLGQRLMRALQGDSNTGWPAYLLLWLGLVVGGIAGAAAFLAIGFSAMWLAVVGAVALAVTMPEPKLEAERI